MKIIIDPRGGYSYLTYYILGFEQVFGKSNISYDIKPFLDLDYSTESKWKSGFPMIFIEDGKQYKFFLDPQDPPQIEEERYAWCDVYGKVNPEFNAKDKYPKMIYLGPEFGLRLHSLPWLVTKAVTDYIKIRKYTAEPFQAVLKNYLYTFIRRRSISYYERKTDIRGNYIFHASTLWYNNFAKTDTNYWRGEYLKACKKAGIEIEGGLYYIGDLPSVLAEMPDYPKYKEIYKDFIYDKRLPMDDYIRKTKESVMVFNTPSVCGCHGWKLAEYLCMGKAIISTPFQREMPYPMEHGKNIHFVNTSQELYDAVVKISTDDEYRHQLEQGARDYYEKWVAPSRVVKRMVEACRQK